MGRSRKNRIPRNYSLHMTLKQEPLESSAHPSEQLIAQFLGLAYQMFDYTFPVGAFIGFHSLSNIGLAVLQEARDQAGQFVGGGYDSFRRTQAHLQAPEEGTYCTVTVMQDMAANRSATAARLALGRTLRARILPPEILRQSASP